MKNKPLKHKETNVFKFKSFADRIADVDIRKAALYHIEHVNTEVADENSTQFYLALQKWTTLNLTDEYYNFQKDFKNIITLPQLIHKKDFVIEHLLDGIKSGTTLSLQPILELIVVAAKDLREEFYSYFSKVLSALISLLNTKDPDQLEWTLVCLAFLFKTLKIFLKKDISIIFLSLLPLLDENKPEHITNFAAECFSYIARDIKDKEKFLILLLKTVKKSKHEIVGCGRLLFEIVRGVNGQFHSCSENFLTIFFEYFGKDENSQELLFEILTQTVNNILEGITQKEMPLFWNVSFKVLEQFLMQCTSNDNCNIVTKAIYHFLGLIGQTVEYMNGKYLNEPVALIKYLIKTSDVDLSEDIYKIIAQMATIILLSPRLTITQLDANRLCKKILSIPNKNIFEFFIWNTINYSQFEILILPDFLKYFEKNFNHKTLELLSKVIDVKAPQCRNGMHYDDRKSYPIYLKNPETIEKIEGIIIDKKQIDDITDDFLLAITIYPHINGSKKNVIEKLNEKVTNLCETLLIEDEPIDGKEIEEYETNKKLLFYLSVIVENLLRLDGNTNVEEIINVILPYCKDLKYIQAIHLLDFCITTMKKNLLYAKNMNEIFFYKIHSVISDNLSSPYKIIRLLTSHTLSLFSHLTLFKGESEEKITLYELIYSVESIQPDVHNYRDQLVLLQKLNVDTLFYQHLKEHNLHLDAMKYLLGLLYINFKLLWQHLIEILTGYSGNFEVDEFWIIFKKKLEFTVFSVHNEKYFNDLNNKNTFFDNNLLNEKINNDLLLDGMPDFVNYRILLWRALGHFTNIVEIKNKDIVTLFFDFVNHEYRKFDKEAYGMWNILKENCTEDDNDETLTLNDSNNVTEKQKYPKSLQKTLITKLQIFKTVNNPKQLYMQSSLFELYLQLLCHKNEEIQKLSLDCIINYKYPYVMPYKENLINILDDKKLKEELRNFKIDKNDTTILSDHRDNLMEILIRLLYSKLSVKVNHLKARQTLVLRFLASCKENEILLFIKMAFKNLLIYFDNTVDEEPIDIYNKYINNIDLTCVPSPKKLQYSLELLDKIRENFAGLMSYKFQKYLLKIITTIGTISLYVINNGITIKTGIINIYKTLKSTCMNNIINIFNHLDEYKWTNNDINVIFNLFIWPTLDKLPDDSVHSIINLLKLFLSWSKNARYFILLVKCQENNKTLTPLPYIMKLLLNIRTRPSVVRVIMEIVEKLLTLDDDMTNRIIIDNIVERNQLLYNEIKLTTKLNYGSEILLPYIPMILERLQKNFSKKHKKNVLSKTELIILSRATELVTDSNTCELLLSLLLPIIIKNKTKSDEILLQELHTINNLLIKITNPLKHIKLLSMLFEFVTCVSNRKQLFNIFKTISDKIVDLEYLTDIICELNAYDKRWIEQPDYDRRLNAFKTIENLIKENNIDINLGLIVIYHCFYFLKTDKDLAIRDRSSYTLKQLLPMLIKKYESNKHECEYLIGNVILNMVRNTIRGKNDMLRNEAIQLLGELARQCPTSHVVLSDLYLLTNDNDRDNDFFDNITHLQYHRHQRALERFISASKTFETLPNIRTLTQFLLPVTTLYLCQELPEVKQPVANTAIETIGFICKLLPWSHYETILKFYLQKLRFDVEHQKQIVKIIMSILDAFHFDLCNALDLPVITESDAVTISIEKKIKNIFEDTTEMEVDENEIEEADDNDDDKIDDSLLDAELDNVEPMENDETEIKTVKQVQKIYVINKNTILSESAAKRLIYSIKTGLLPMLNKAISDVTRHDGAHKVNRKKYGNKREEEDILRVPIALAIVRLLQKLPKQIFDQNLPGVFMRICTFLKSPLRSVRMVTRDTLRKIMTSIGPEYLQILLSQMTVLLNRGFQVHVLVVTVHNLLDALKDAFRPGDMDKNMRSILGICLEDIFGRISEEKEINKIVTKTPEAKTSNKSFIMLNIIARSINESCLLDLLLPFKEHLSTSYSKKVVNKVQLCLQKILSGFCENTNITVETLLILIYGTISESIPDLLPGTPKPELTEVEKDRMKRLRPDCFLIQPEPKTRAGAIMKIAKTNVRTNAHVLVEFGLEMLHIILKRGKLNTMDYGPFLEPIIPILYDAIKSTNVRVTTFAIKCFITIWNNKLQLIKLKELISNIVEEIFTILHKYGRTCLTNKDDNYTLVRNCFKSMVTLLRSVKYYELTSDQLKLLLIYIEQDLYDFDRQNSAFSLLKAILGRKLIVPEINDVMKKVSDICITSETANTREEARSINMLYLMEYPLGNKIDTIVKFFILQLNYELETGRDSAIKMIHLMIKKFPENIINSKSGLLFVSLGARLMNDTSAECKTVIATVLEDLIERLSTESRDSLFDIILTLLDDKKLSHKEMAAQLCSRFIAVEKVAFTKRLIKILPPMITNLSFINPSTPGRFVRLINNDDDDESNVDDEAKDKGRDHQIYQILNTLLKMLGNCPTGLTDPIYRQYIDELGYVAQKLLGYEHEWVRLNAARILEQILLTTNIEVIHEKLLSPDSNTDDYRDYIYLNPEQELKSLALDLCAQMQPNVIDKEMASQIVKNLLLIANFIKVIPLRKQLNDNVEDNEPAEEKEDYKKSINLNWLMRRMRYIIHSEVAKSIASTVLRVSVFNWIEGLLVILDDEVLLKLIFHLLAPLIRELSLERNSHENLKQLSTKICTKIKLIIGRDQYNKIINKIQTNINMKRAERRKLMAEERIINPLNAAKRKKSIADKKKLTKKRKVDDIRSGKLIIKKKRQHDEMEMF